MILTQEHIQILREIGGFATVKRYHGMLPEKHAILYDEEILASLLEQELVEEGAIFSQCGASSKGYRLSAKAREQLKDLGLEFDHEDWEKISTIDFVSQDGLGQEHIDLLTDMQHFSRISLYGGIVPKEIMEEYDKKVVGLLYDGGYIFYIKLKGAGVRHKKGYVLSEKGAYVLRQIEARP